MSEVTEHGENIAGQIMEEDAYGYFNNLTIADIWTILDQIHTHFMCTNQDTKFLEKWLRELEDIDEDLPTL